MEQELLKRLSRANHRTIMVAIAAGLCIYYMSKQNKKLIQENYILKYGEVIG